MEKETSLYKLGGMNWRLVGCLALSWVICFACLIKGVKSSGKVSCRLSSLIISFTVGPIWSGIPDLVRIRTKVPKMVRIYFWDALVTTE